MMVLAKLRLALLNRDLALRFDMSEATVAQTTINLIPVLARTFFKFIIWPMRPNIAQTMQTIVCRYYPRCHIITDFSQRCI